MIVEEPIDAEEVREEESEEHEFLCAECGYQDDTGFQSCPMCDLTAALDEQEEEEEEKRWSKRGSLPRANVCPVSWVEGYRGARVRW